METKLAASCSQELQRKNYNKHLKKENCQNLEYRRKKERKYKLEEKMLKCCSPFGNGLLKKQKRVGHSELADTDLPLNTSNEFNENNNNYTYIY